MDLLVADIGGTRARFAIAHTPGDRIELTDAAVLSVANHDDFPSALSSYAEQLQGPLPPHASFALATDVTGDVAGMVNSDWVIDRRDLVVQFGFETCLLLNDLEAATHAVAAAKEAEFVHLFGPRGAFRRPRCASIIGPGTGLGVAQLIRADDHYHAVASEGGHIAFAPQDAFERQLYEALSDRHGRVSVERVASGPALAEFYRLIAGVSATPDAKLWSSAIEGTDEAAVEALDRFIRTLGSVVGDLALAHGSERVVVIGSLGGRLRGRLQSDAFQKRFIAKGRFSRRMRGIDVLYLSEDQPGLIGAAIAAQELAE